MRKKEIRTAWQLLRKNLWNLVLFEAIYRVFSNLLIRKAAGFAVDFSLKRQGFSYMTSENFNAVMLHPLTMLLIAGVLLLFLLLMLFEVYAVLGCLEGSWRRARLTVPGLFRAGARGCIYLIRRHPLGWIWYMAASVPYLWLQSSYNGIRTMKLLQVSLTKIAEAFPKVWMPVVLVLLLILFSFLYSYTLPFRFMMEEKKKDVIRRTREAMRGRWKTELCVNVLLQAVIFVSGFVLLLVGELGVVLYAELVKSPSTIVSAVIIYGDWVKVAMGMVTGALGMVGGVTYLYLNFIESNRSGYRRNERSGNSRKRRESRLVRAARGPVVAAVLTLCMMIGEGVYVVYAMQQDLPSATASSQYISVSAHRGGARKAPENTMSAIQYAVESMSDYAEIDVQETSDGEIVLLHDSNLKRTTGLNANVWTLTYDEISHLDAGARFNQSFRGEPVPKLEDIIKYAKGKIKLNIEVKYNGHNQNIVKKVIRIIEKNDFVENCVLTSMNYSFLRQAKKLNPDIKTGYTMKMSYGDLQNMDASDFFSVKYTYINERFVERAHSLGKEVCAWTPNYQGDMQRMVNCGVDNIITDDPELVRKVILGNTQKRPDFLTLLRFALD